jgi:hypothetical protein
MQQNRKVFFVTFSQCFHTIGTCYIELYVNFEWIKYALLLGKIEETTELKRENKRIIEHPYSLS